MSSLENIQMQFADAILDERKCQADSVIQENGLTSEKRMQIYRNNIFITLTAALKNIYPITQLLVGDDFFESMAYGYIHSVPTYSGDLNDFGGQFPEFVADFKPARSLAYLPEMAQLEWACHQMYYAQNDIADQIFQFKFPIFDIWTFCKKNDRHANLVLKDKGDSIAVKRIGFDVILEKLSKN